MAKKEETLDIDTDWEKIESVFSKKDDFERSFIGEILKIVDSVDVNHFEFFIKKEIPLVFYVAGSNLNSAETEAIEGLRLSFLRNLEHEGVIKNLKNKTTDGDDFGNNDVVFHSAEISFYPYILFDYLKNKLSDALTVKKSEQIYYDEQTSIGYFKNKKFRLKTGTPECSLFEKLHKRINKRFEREDVVEILKKYPELKTTGIRDGAATTQETYPINEVVKSLRKKIGLNSAQLVQNAGNITLIATKITTPPKIPQTLPK